MMSPVKRRWEAVLLLLLASSGITTALADGVTLSANPTTLNFGDQVTGTQGATQTVTVTAQGEDGATLSAVSSSSVQFPIVGGTCAVGQRVGGKVSTCTVLVAFRPTATVSARTQQSGTVTVSTRSGSTSVAVSGYDVPPPPVAVLSPASSSLTVGVGDSKVATFTLTNNGPGSLQGIVVSLSARSGLSQNSNCSSSLSANSSCTITVTATPTAGGTITANVGVASSNGAPITPASLTVNVVVPTMSVSASPTSFGSVALKATSAPSTLTVTNNGPAGKFSVQSIVSSNNDFSVSQTNCSGVSLAAGANCTAQVTFKPTTAGNESSTITVTSTAANSPQTVTLSGTGIAAAGVLTVSPSSMSFTSKCKGESPGGAAQTVSVSNTGTGDLSGLSVTLSGAAFSIDNSCGATLRAGDHCAVRVRFNGRTAGTGFVSVAATGAISRQVLLSSTCTTPSSP
jgi:hypothetical protein